MQILNECSFELYISGDYLNEKQEYMELKIIRF